MSEDIQVKQRKLECNEIKKTYEDIIEGVTPDDEIEIKQSELKRLDKDEEEADKIEKEDILKGIAKLGAEHSRFTEDQRVRRDLSLILTQGRKRIALNSARMSYSRLKALESKNDQEPDDVKE